MITAYWLAVIISSLVGVGACIYGKRRQNWKTWLIGALLSVYSIFITDTWLVILISCVLIAALFIFRD